MPSYDEMKNEELAAEAKSRGLPHSGTNAELIDRLSNDDAAKGAEARGEAQGPVEQGVAVAAPDPADANVDPAPYTEVKPVSGSELPENDFQRPVE